MLLVEGDELVDLAHRALLAAFLERGQHLHHLLRAGLGDGLARMQQRLVELAAAELAERSAVAPAAEPAEVPARELAEQARPDAEQALLDQLVRVVERACLALRDAEADPREPVQLGPGGLGQLGELAVGRALDDVLEAREQLLHLLEALATLGERRGLQEAASHLDDTLERAAVVAGVVPALVTRARMVTAAHHLAEQALALLQQLAEGAEVRRAALALRHRAEVAEEALQLLGALRQLRAALALELADQRVHLGDARAQLAAVRVDEATVADQRERLHGALEAVGDAVALAVEEVGEPAGGVVPRGVVAELARALERLGERGVHLVRVVLLLRGVGGGAERPAVLRRAVVHRPAVERAPGRRLVPGLLRLVVHRGEDLRDQPRDRVADGLRGRSAELAAEPVGELSPDVGGVVLGRLPGLRGRQPAEVASRGGDRQRELAEVVAFCARRAELERGGNRERDAAADVERLHAADRARHAGVPLQDHGGLDAATGDAVFAVLGEAAGVEATDHPRRSGACARAHAAAGDHPRRRRGVRRVVGQLLARLQGRAAADEVAGGAVLRLGGTGLERVRAGGVRRVDRVLSAPAEGVLAVRALQRRVGRVLGARADGVRALRRRVVRARVHGVVPRCRGDDLRTARRRVGRVVLRTRVDDVRTLRARVVRRASVVLRAWMGDVRALRARVRRAAVVLRARVVCMSGVRTLASGVSDRVAGRARRVDLRRGSVGLRLRKDIVAHVADQRGGVAADVGAEVLQRAPDPLRRLGDAAGSALAGQIGRDAAELAAGRRDRQGQGALVVRLAALPREPRAHVELHAAAEREPARRRRLRFGHGAAARKLDLHGDDAVGDAVGALGERRDRVDRADPAAGRVEHRLGRGGTGSCGGGGCAGDRQLAGVLRELDDGGRGLARRGLGCAGGDGGEDQPAGEYVLLQTGGRLGLGCRGGVLLVFVELALGGEVALPDLFVLAARAIALGLQRAALGRQGRVDAGVRARLREGAGGEVDRALPRAEQRDEVLRPHALQGGELLPERLPRADRFVELPGDVEVGGPRVEVLEARERLLDQRFGRAVLDQLGRARGDRRLEVPRRLGPGPEHGREAVAAGGVVLQPAV